MLGKSGIMVLEIETITGEIFMFVLQANDSFEVLEYLECWDYEAGECIGFSYTKSLDRAKKYSCLDEAWIDLRDHGFQINLMIMGIGGG